MAIPVAPLTCRYLTGVCNLLKTLTRIRRPQKAMGLVLQSSLFDKRHRWSTVSTHAPSGKKCQYLTKGHFHADAKKRSMPFGEVVESYCMIYDRKYAVECATRYGGNAAQMGESGASGRARARPRYSGRSCCRTPKP